MLYDLLYLSQQAINALQQGSIYALIALGYSMVYGVLTMINFAHGDLFMLGAFACMLLAVVLVPALSFLPPLLVLAIIFVLVMGIIGFLGAFIERVAYRPLRSAPRVSAIITALGCGLFIESVTLLKYPSSQPMKRPQPSAVMMAETRGALRRGRSEEHTSELQSHTDIVC